MRSRRVMVGVVLAGLLAVACSSDDRDGAAPPDGQAGEQPASAYRAVALEPPGAGEGSGPSTANWGQRLREAPDLDGDGAREVLVGDPAHSVDGSSLGRVLVVSGANRSVLYEFSAPPPAEGRGFGTYVSVFTGRNGPAAAVGSNEETVKGRPGQGRAYVFSLAADEANLLYALDDPTAEEGARFGERIGRAGDVVGHGDGSSDLIVAAPGRDLPPGCSKVPDADPVTCRANVGQALIFDGTTGALVRSLDMPADDVGASPACNRRSSCGNFASAVQSPGDIDGDGRGDQLVSASDYDFPTGSGAPCGKPEPNGCNEAQGRQYLFSGADGAILATIEDPEPQAEARFGFQDVAPDSPGDVNGDGVADLYANGFQQKGPLGADEGGAWVFDGRKTVEQGTGVVLYKLIDPSPSAGGQFGWSMARTDYEPDGDADLLVGSAPHHFVPTAGAPWPDQRGGVAVLDGSDGTPLEVLDLPSNMGESGSDGNLGANLGWSLAAPGDLDGDGRPDYVAGAPFADVGGIRDLGRVVFFLSG